MRPAILCRERLNRIFAVLDRNDGVLSVRDFMRSYGVYSWELEQAATLGWVMIETLKPSVGRPSRTIRRLSETQFAKLPPRRCEISHEISIRHDNFARRSVYESMRGGWKRFGIPSYVTAYLRSFPDAKKRGAASASASRLLQHPDVAAARQWYYAIFGREIPVEPMPPSAKEIWTRLRELNCWRAEYTPRWGVTYKFR